MSIYSLNEICKNCIHAKFIDSRETHIGKSLFLSCDINVESFVDFLRDECDDRKVPKNPVIVYDQVELTIKKVVEG